ncbi:MAG: hypothetical protein AVDCRST_MAG54-1185, partial [uncultured Actinomycetospora sp.]
AGQVDAGHHEELARPVHDADRAAVGRRHPARGLLRPAPARRVRLGRAARGDARGGPAPGVGGGAPARGDVVRRGDAGGVRPRPRAGLRRGRPAVPAGQGLVRHRAGGPRVPREPAVRQAADALGVPDVAAAPGRRDGGVLPDDPAGAAHVPAQRRGVGRRPAARGDRADPADLPAADRRHGRGVGGDDGDGDRRAVDLERLVRRPHRPEGPRVGAGAPGGRPVSRL